MEVALLSFSYNIMLIGAIQGFIFSGFIFCSKKYNSKSNFFLGLLIVTLSYNILQNYLVISDLFRLDHYFEHLYIPFTAVFLVLFYLYVKFFLYPDSTLTQADCLLFLPFSIAFLESIFEKTGYATGFFNYSDVIYFNYFRIAQETFNVGFSFVLIIISYRFILKFEKQQTDQSKFPRIRLMWLKIITLVFLALCVYWVVPLYFEFQFKIQEAVLYFCILWLGLSLTIYILGHIGIYQFGIVQEQKKIREFSKNHSIPAIKTHNYVNSQNENIILFENFIRKEKNYLNGHLSLDMTAEQLGINKSYLSRIINTELGKSFSDYVNELRVEEAKSYIANPEFQNYTLVSIGLEAGFNSKTVFNNAFKKFTGLTPSDYRKNLNSKV